MLEVAPGVHWIRMPLPYSLDHINLWSIADGDGCAVVDTGVRTDETVAIWRSLGNSVPGLDKVTRVFVTHMHPDHVGMAGWLTRKFDCRLWMSRLEYLNCRVTTSDTGREAPPDGVAFYRAAGWSETALEAYCARFGRFGQHIHAPPDSFRRLQDGDEITIGDHARRVVIGMGHSPEHACLYSPALKLFISGDRAAAHLVQRLGLPDGARRRPDRRLVRLAGQDPAPCRTTCWCCRRTTSASAACTPARQAAPRAGQEPAAAARGPRASRAARSTCSARCSRGPSPNPTVPCWAWRPARASPA